ncbi:hypothetical protein ACJJTC_017999 [Scirpophaga incertulas]
MQNLPPGMQPGVRREASADPSPPPVVVEEFEDAAARLKGRGRRLALTGIEVGSDRKTERGLTVRENYEILINFNESFEMSDVCIKCAEFARNIKRTLAARLDNPWNAQIPF